MAGAAATGGGSVAGRPGAIVFSSDRASGTGAPSGRELYLTYGPGSAVRRLTYNRVADSDPAVSPDGRLLAFDRGNVGDEDVWVMRVAGGGLRRLTANRLVYDVEPSWSPDGTRIALASSRAGGRLHVFVMDSNGAHVRRLTGGDWIDSGPEWSPDGGWIAFTRESPDGRSTQLRAVRPDGTGLRRLPAAAGAHALSWSPDGRAYAYLAALPGSSPDDERNGLFVTRGRRTRLIRANVSRRPAWTPDGGRILFGDGGSIASVAPDGSGYRQETAGAPGVSDQPAVQRRCDVSGTASGDTLVGTPADDVICGFGGNDVIRGGGGDDVLLGGDGDDTLVGGAGTDLVFGGRGNDTLLGRDGTRDVLDGGPGRDRIVADRVDVVR